MNLITLMSLKLVNNTKLCSIAKYNEMAPPYAPTKQNHDEGEQWGGLHTKAMTCCQTTRKGKHKNHNERE
jgi:hypothetical protein